LLKTSEGNLYPLSLAPEDMGKFGPGVALYFTNIKSLLLILMLMTILSLPSYYYNASYSCSEDTTGRMTTHTYYMFECPVVGANSNASNGTCGQGECHCCADKCRNFENATGISKNNSVCLTVGMVDNSYATGRKATFNSNCSQSAENYNFPQSLTMALSLGNRHGMPSIVQIFIEGFTSLMCATAE
jgi:hypothetical protein